MTMPDPDTTTLQKEIDQRKKAEKDNEELLSCLREAQHLEALGTLAGGIAHDFNNILGSILGYAQLLQMDVKDNEKGTHYTKQIINGCNRAKNLTLQILEFSRKRESESAVKTPVLASAMIKEKVKLLQASIPSSIKIRANIQKDSGYILASPTQIHQIIMNLCTNALHAIKENQGSITIAMENICLNGSNSRKSVEPDIIHGESAEPDHLPYGKSVDPDLPHGEYVTISVEDDGKGMTPEIRGKIFDPYFSTKTGRGGDGTGLGLSMVHGIVKRCKGGIKLESAPGKGTRITLYFPLHTPQKKQKTAETAAIQPGKGRVMLVDDEQMLVDLGKMMLEKLGYQALTLKSPREALDIIKKNPEKFDIVLTDLTMPDIKGTQLAEKIKNIRPDLPVILVTGFSNITTTEKANSTFIDAVLSKPLSINALATTLQKFINN